MSSTLWIINVSINIIWHESVPVFTYVRTPFSNYPQLDPVFCYNGMWLLS